MTSMLTRIQLAVFMLVTAAAMCYGAVQFFDVANVLDPPYEVTAEFDHAGGIYPRADVELLGTRVGKVRSVRPGPDGTSKVVLSIDDGVEIPLDVTARIGNKSAIGEQYVELAPASSGGPSLSDGDSIPLSRTKAPLPMEQLISHGYALANSVPVGDVAIVIDQLATALAGNGPKLGKLLDGTNRLTRATLNDVDSLTALITDARTVLDTQVDLRPQTEAYLAELAPLLRAVQTLNPDVAKLFASGSQAGTDITGLLRDNQQKIPQLLNNLVSFNATLAGRLPAIRKTLVVFPWTVELSASAVRYCTNVRPDGTPVQATCAYDAQGRPWITTRIATQLPQLPGQAPYNTCRQGYGSTRRFRPDGVAMDGGPREAPDQEPNLAAGCTASPYDPNSPNVRGPQNVPEAGPLPRPPPSLGLAVYDTRSGLIVAPDRSTVRLTGASGPPPPAGDAGLAWLLSPTDFELMR